MDDGSITQNVGKAVDEGWATGSAFVGSILSGLLIGYLLDRWLGTSPWFVIAFIVLGAYSGFMRMWSYAKRTGEIQDEERRRARD